MKNNGTFVKWAGGKSQLIEQYKPFFPKKIDRYFEPFLGSGAVFFFVKKNFNPKEIFLSDINEELIITFKVVRDKVEDLIKSLMKRKQLNSKEYFYKVRKEKSQELSDVERASRLIYLNKTCYNGLYRVNTKGEFNVPFGKYKNPSIFDEKILREASKLLKGANIEVVTFDTILNTARKGDFIYFDPETIVCMDEDGVEISLFRPSKLSERFKNYDITKNFQIWLKEEKPKPRKDK